MLRHRCVLLLSSALLGGAAFADNEKYTDFGPLLREAKELWLDNCEGCHGYGIAGAPIPMRSRDWSSRVVKPRQELYANAINGFFGPDDTYMPARGGNNQLTDNEVMMAVDYMVTLASHWLITQQDAQQ